MKKISKGVRLHTRMGPVQRQVLANALMGAKSVSERTNKRGTALRAFLLAVERGTRSQIMSLWSEICDLELQSVVVLRNEESAARCMTALKERFPRTRFHVPQILDGVDIGQYRCNRMDDTGDLVDDVEAHSSGTDTDDPLFVDSEGEYAGTLDWCGNHD